jgi:hypothetical protein
MGWGLSNADIGRALNISRQAVGKHVRKGMPTDSIEHARSWYLNNVGFRGGYKRGTFSRLPTRVVTTAFDAAGDDSLDYLDRVSREGLDNPPPAQDDPPRLDNFAEEFWSDDPCMDICNIVCDGDETPLKTPEGVADVFHCLHASMRLHLFLMPTILASRVGAKDREAAEQVMYDWVRLFCRHWWGEGFEDLPMLSQRVSKLSEWYHPFSKDEAQHVDNE